MQSDWSKDAPNPLRYGIVQQDVEVFKDGFLELPPGPGLGIELNEEVSERYRTDRAQKVASAARS
jgi:L-alanine-DL-glutamate epimerase-like enolase superfamily enzyme